MKKLPLVSARAHVTAVIEVLIPKLCAEGYTTEAALERAQAMSMKSLHDLCHSELFALCVQDDKKDKSGE